MLEVAGAAALYTALMYVLMCDSYPRLRTPTIAFLGFIYLVVAALVDAIAYGHLLTVAQLSERS